MGVAQCWPLAFRLLRQPWVGSGEKGSRAVAAMSHPLEHLPSRVPWVTVSAHTALTHPLVLAASGAATSFLSWNNEPDLGAFPPKRSFPRLQCLLSAQGLVMTVQGFILLLSLIASLQNS